MKILSHEHILSAIDKGDFFATFYLFYGENEFYKNFVLKEIEKKLIPQGVRDLNFKIFYSDEISNDISSLIEFARSFPFMSEKKLAVVKDIDRIGKSILNSLLAYLKAPTDFTCIIFTAQKPDFKLEFFKYIRDSEKAVQFRQFNEFETISWIKKMATQLGMHMKQEACVYLYYAIGNNLYELYSEIQKIFSYYGKNKTIGIDEVKFIVSSSKNYTIFELVDSIFQKKISDSLRILNVYLEREGKEKALSIIGMLIRQLSLIQKTKNIIQMGGDIKKIQKEVQPYMFLAKKLIAQSKLWTQEDIENTLFKLSEADAHIKTGISPLLVIEQLIVSICS